MKPIKIPTRWMMAALLGLTLAGPVAGQDGTDPFELFKLFNFCQPVRLVVAPFVDLDEDAAIGLTSEAIQKTAALRLRLAQLYDDSVGGGNFLTVNVRVVGAAFSVDVWFNKRVYDLDTLPEGMVAEGKFAKTWHNGLLGPGVIGTHGRDPNYILNIVERDVDSFLIKYLRVNASACG